MTALPPIDDLARWPHPHVAPTQLAQYWGVHPRTIIRWLRRGQLRGLRLPGGLWRIRRQDALAFERALFAGATQADPSAPVPPRGPGRGARLA